MHNLLLLCTLPGPSWFLDGCWQPCKDLLDISLPLLQNASVCNCNKAKRYCMDVIGHILHEANQGDYNNVACAL